MLLECTAPPPQLKPNENDENMHFHWQLPTSYGNVANQGRGFLSWSPHSPKARGKMYAIRSHHFFQPDLFSTLQAAKNNPLHPFHSVPGTGKMNLFVELYTKASTSTVRFVFTALAVDCQPPNRRDGPPTMGRVCHRSPSTKKRGSVVPSPHPSLFSTCYPPAWLLFCYSDWPLFVVLLVIRVPFCNCPQDWCIHPRRRELVGEWWLVKGTIVWVDDHHSSGTCGEVFAICLVADPLLKTQVVPVAAPFPIASLLDPDSPNNRSTAPEATSGSRHRSRTFRKDDFTFWGPMPLFLDMGTLRGCRPRRGNQGHV